MEKIQTTFGQLTHNQAKIVYFKLIATGMIKGADIYSSCSVVVEKQPNDSPFDVFTIELTKDVSIIVKQ